MDPFDDKQIETVYELYRRDHNGQREQLLRSLEKTKSSDRQVAGDPRADEEHVDRPVDRSPVSRSARAIRMAIAASVIFALAALTLFNFWGETSKTYGIEHLPERLLTIRNLFIKGHSYRTIITEDGKEELKKFPERQYAERPYRFWVETNGFAHSGDRPTEIRLGYYFGDETQATVVSTTDRTATIRKKSTLSAELFVESLLQRNIFDRFTGQALDGFTKSSTEEIAGVLCDVYESTSQPESGDGGSDFVDRIWIDPNTGLPRKSGTWQKTDSGEEPLFITDEMQFNVDRMPAEFVMEIPAGYEVTQAPELPDELSAVGSGSAGDTSLATWYAFNIDDRAVLLCWSQHDCVDGEKQWFAREPEIWLEFAGQIRACENKLISTAHTGGKRWRWTLFIPTDRKRISNEYLRMQIHDNGSTVFIGKLPLRFPEQRLEAIIEQASAIGNQDAKRFTLDQIRLQFSRQN